MIEIGENAALNEDLLYAAFVDEALYEHLFEGIAALLTLRDLLLQDLLLKLNLEYSTVGAITHLGSCCEVLADELRCLLVGALSKRVLRLDHLLILVFPLFIRSRWLL